MDKSLLIWIEAVVIAALVIAFTLFVLLRKRRMRKYFEKVAYNTADAKNSTLQNFQMPIAVFKLEDTGIIWGNDMFFALSGEKASHLDAKMTDIIPGFSCRWLSEGKTQYPSLMQIGGKKFRIHGSVVRKTSQTDDGSDSAYMAITYWVDVTELDDIRIEYENSRPVAAIAVIDNLDEMYKNQPDRARNDILEAVGEKLAEWAAAYNAILRRYDRDRFIAVFEKRDLKKMKEEKFPVIEQMHSIENPAGVSASISIGLSEDAQNFAEALQFADMANELALTRGGDQAVIKNRLSFEFFGGRGSEIEKRTKVKSRVMANTLAELIKDSSRVFIMGHKYSDLDSVGAAVGVCCLCRKLNVQAKIIVDEANTASANLIARMREEDEYRNVFTDAKDALIKADGRTLLVVVDTNRPEQVEDADILDACNKVAIIDHHRVSSTYIQNAALGFIEPYSSSTCELIVEILQELTEKNDLLKCECDALLSGIVLDTKNFTIRTGERTFDAAAYLRREGADTTDVKKLLQSDLKDTIAKYRILQNAELYRNVAIAVPTAKQSRIVAAKAADELLNIVGVDASIVIAPGENGEVFASARSIGELNVQIIMEKVGGGGNRSVAAAQFKDTSLEDAVEKIYRAIDDYLG